MVPLLQQILDATEKQGAVAEVTWGEIRPMCTGHTDPERVRAFLRWCLEHNRAAVVPDLAGPNRLADAAVISVTRIS